MVTFKKNESLFFSQRLEIAVKRFRLRFGIGQISHDCGLDDVGLVAVVARVFADAAKAFDEPGGDARIARMDPASPVPQRLGNLGFAFVIVLRPCRCRWE